MNQLDIDELLNNFANKNEELMDVDSSPQSIGDSQSRIIGDVLEQVRDFLSNSSFDEAKPILEKLVPACIQHLPNLSREAKSAVVKFIGKQIDSPLFANGPNELEENRSHIGKLVLEALANKGSSEQELARSLEERERICEAFHFFLDHNHENPSHATRLVYEMSRSCDGIEDLHEELVKHAVENFSTYFEQLYKPELMIEEATVMGAVLRSVQEVCKYESEDKMMSALPFLVRSLASRLPDKEEWNESLDATEKEIAVKWLTKIASKFYSQPKSTLERWRALTKQSAAEERPIGELACNVEDPHLLVLDGSDLFVVNECGGSLKDSPLKLFLFDTETGYARGMVDGWSHTEKLAMEDEPLTAANVCEFFEFLENANPHGGSRLRTDGVGYPFDQNELTADGLADIIKFRDSFNKKKVKGRPRITLSINNVEVSRPSYARAKEKGIKIHSGKTDPAALATCINKLFGEFDKKLEVLKKEKRSGETESLLERLEDAAMDVARKLEWLHPGNDGNGRVCAYFVRNACLLKGQRALGLSPSAIIFPDPYSVEVKSLAEGREVIEEAKELSTGELKIADASCGLENLTLQEAMELNLKYPREDRKKGEPGWIADNMPDETDAYLVEKSNLEDGNIKSIIFRHSTKTPVKPVVIYKLEADEIPSKVKKAVHLGGKSARFKPITVRETSEVVETPVDTQALDEGPPRKKRRPNRGV